MTHEYLPSSIGERLHDLLLEKKMTQAELAQKVGTSPATMTRYVNGTSDIPHPVLQAMSKVLGVSVDFLLGSTNIPYRMNYDIEELGLTAEAASKLYSGELDPHVVSQLLTNPHFPQLVEQIRAFLDGTNSAAFASYNQVMNIGAKLVQRQGKVMPHDKANAKRALQDVKEHMVPPTVPDMTMIRTAFEFVLNDLKKQAEEHVKDATLLTGDIMRGMVKSIDKRQGPSLQQVTANDLAEAVMEQIAAADLSEESRAELDEHVLGIFNSVMVESDKKSQRRK